MSLRIPRCRAAVASLAMVWLSLSGCSTSQLVARGAAPLIDHGVASMNRETDLELARASIPANLKMIEALLLADPGNASYRVQAAMGFQGYALGFVEADDSDRAVALYQRAREHAPLLGRNCLIRQLFPYKGITWNGTIPQTRMPTWE